MGVLEQTVTPSVDKCRRHCRRFLDENRIRPLDHWSDHGRQDDRDQHPAASKLGSFAFVFRWDWRDAKAIPGLLHSEMSIERELRPY